MNSTEPDPLKTEMILLHRQAKSQFAMLEQSLPYKTALSFVAPITQPSITDLLGLKQIFLAEMIASDNKIYEGFVLKLTVIEEPIFSLPSMPMLAEDEKSGVERISIYNFNWDWETLKENFAFGSKFSIVNPFFRIATDGKSAIRVDDPGTIVFHPTLSDKGKCRFCESPSNSTIKCLKCLKAFYCSNKCLKNDAKVWKHNLICRKN